MDDLVLARDAVGLASANSDRLAGTLTLLYGTVDWATGWIEHARQVLARHTREVCGSIDENSAVDSCTVAAARSVSAILLQPADRSLSALAIRRRERTEVGCYIADDSLRKRETPVLRAIAHAAYEEMRGRPADELPTGEAAYQLMCPFVEAASDAVSAAVDAFNRQTEVDEDTVVNAAADAIWAIAYVCVLPIYAGPVQSALPRTAERTVLDQLVTLLVFAPFGAREDDPEALVRALRQEEAPQAYVERMVETAETREIVRHLERWLNSCDQSCMYFRSDKPLGYCPPHYYVAVCQAFLEAMLSLTGSTLRADIDWLLAPRVRPYQADGSYERAAD